LRGVLAVTRASSSLLEEHIVDAAIQAILTISLFAAVHERAVELARGAAERAQFAKHVVDRVTVGPAAVLPAIALAVGTHANLLALFDFDRGSVTSKYFELYLSYGPSFLTPRDVMGCVLMGLSAALGSKFWHDLAYGLVDLRQKTRAVSAEAIASMPPPKPTPEVRLAIQAP
jgi:hypothetical protein